ncbi:DNA-directed RNA polymerase subunit alpha [Microgenomates group bacterium]|nr:DNA-directed RNA polymerase subunit alpha [Microgenomates group bacterium]
MFKANFKITVVAETKDFGKFEISPLETGYGLTLGNALRRVLLTSLPGTAVTSILVDGVTHQFTTLQGVREDIVELVLNLKQVRFEYQGNKPVAASISAAGPAKIKAGDIKVPATVKVVNKDLVLATLADKKSTLNVKLEINSGCGYSPAKDRTAAQLGEIVLDATFTPVVRVNYTVEASRVGRSTDLDKLVMEIYTDGSLKPSKALKDSAEILIAYFTQVVHPTFAKEAKKVVAETDDDEALKLSVEELDLPTRIANALKKGGYAYVKDFNGATREEIAKVKNLGGKSVDIILKKLKNKGIDIQ